MSTLLIWAYQYWKSLSNCQPIFSLFHLFLFLLLPTDSRTNPIRHLKPWCMPPLIIWLMDCAMPHLSESRFWARIATDSATYTHVYTQHDQHHMFYIFWFDYESSIIQSGRTDQNVHCLIDILNDANTANVNVNLSTTANNSNFGILCDFKGVALPLVLIKCDLPSSVFFL